MQINNQTPAAEKASGQQYPVSIETSEGTLRIATYEEVTACLRDMEAQIAWNAARDFAYQLFGEKAYRVEVITSNGYDGGSPYTVFENVTVYDALGNQLPYDLSLPYWSQPHSGSDEGATSLLQGFEIWLKEEETNAGGPLSQAERERLLQVYADEYVQDNNLYANEFDLCRQDSTFLLNESLSQSGPLLYAFLDQEEMRQSLQPLGSLKVD